MSISKIDSVRSEYTVRLIEARDNLQIAFIIRSVLKEFGADGTGFAYTDPEVDSMYETYQPARSAYFVVEHQGSVVGGGGYSPLKGKEETCELQKMYLQTANRGHGLGAVILERCLERAQIDAYLGCYLETLTHMTQAQRLYHRFGFNLRTSSMGDTGHCGCNTFYYKAFDGFE